MPTPPVIDDRNAFQFVRERDFRRGPDATPRDPGCRERKSAYGAKPTLVRLRDVMNVIPRKDWREIITANKGVFLHDLCQGVLPPHDQGQTNYCWAHGTTRTLEVLNVWSGKRPQLFSAESVAVPLTHGENRGGTSDEALQQLCDKGACPAGMWPSNDLDASHADNGWQVVALRNRIMAWIDVNGFEEQITCAIRRLPVAIGLRWWGHLVCQVDPVILPDNTIGIGFHNSWGDGFGDHGYGLLTESRGTADLGAFAPLSATWPNL